MTDKNGEVIDNRIWEATQESFQKGYAQAQKDTLKKVDDIIEEISIKNPEGVGLIILVEKLKQRLSHLKGQENKNGT